MKHFCLCNSQHQLSYSAINASPNFDNHALAVTATHSCTDQRHETRIAIGITGSDSEYPKHSLRHTMQFNSYMHNY